MSVLIWCSVMPDTEMVWVTALVGSSSFLDQDGLEHRSPLSSDTLMNNGSSGDILMAGLMYNFLSPSFPVSFALSSDFFALSPPSNSWRWLNQTLPCVAGLQKIKYWYPFHLFLWEEEGCSTSCRSVWASPGTAAGTIVKWTQCIEVPVNK